MVTRRERDLQAAQDRKAEEEKALKAKQEREEALREAELKRKSKLVQAMMAEIRAMLERYLLVYGLPYEDALSAQATMVLTTLANIHPDNQKVLLPQMLDILDQKERELFGDAPAEESSTTAEPAKPARPAAKIAAKVRGG